MRDDYLFAHDTELDTTPKYEDVAWVVNMKGSPVDSLEKRETEEQGDSAAYLGYQFE
jgi:hypothetical protein